MGLKTWLHQHPVLYEFVQRFRDRRLHAELSRAGSYSQHGEDRIILDLLTQAGAKGPYVDIGCNHPFKYNNTYLLHLRGWRGVCIDPLRRFGPLYQQWRPDDRFVCLAVGEESGEIPFYEFEWDMLSTLDPELAASYREAGHKMLKESVVVVRPVNQVLNESRLPAPVSLLSLDVEGHELTVLKTIDLDLWQPQFVCLEVQTADGRNDSAAADYLKARGYRVARDLGLNLLLQRQ